MAKAQNRQIAYCGLVCSECGAFIATQKNDDKARQEMAAEWTKKYNHPFNAEDINCVGCSTATGKHIGHWGMCEVHKCGAEKGVINCAYCNDYACEKLEGYFKFAPVMKANLEEIRKGLK
jgi:hypothetical protein